MAYDNAPVGNTCGSIDDIISQMEQIRSDNSDLREWGNEQHDRAEDAENELYELKRTEDDLNAEIEDLKSEIDDLKIQLNDK